MCQFSVCSGDEDPLRWDKGCGASLSSHLNPSLLVGQAGNTQLQSPSLSARRTLSLLLTQFFLCLLWTLTGVPAFSVHPKTRKHI